MEICVSTDKFHEKEDDAIVLPYTEEQVQELIDHASSKIDDYLVDSMDDRYFTGKYSQTCILLPEKYFKSRRIILVGLGKEDRLDLDKVRMAMSVAVRRVEEIRLRSFTISLPLMDSKEEDIATAAVEGIILGYYRFDKYKTEDDDKKFKIKEFTILTSDKKADIVAEKAQEAITICENTNIARDLVNDTTYEVQPERLADYARKIALSQKLRCTVISGRDVQKKGMNLLYEVGKGSVHDPHLVIIEYYGKKSSDEKVVLAGKGITFDVGGVHLKPTGYLEMMRFDMAGAAAVIGTMKALCELNVKRNVIAVIPMCENMIGKLAYKPGDIIRSYSGKTVEVVNTDAEGRLILADAIAYAVDKYNPTAVIDIATLTGSSMATFGEHIAAIIGNNKELAARMFKAGQRTHELTWELPIYEEYREKMKSDLADLKNAGYKNGRYAGAITGACFIENFVEDIPWLHIDIAGTAWREDNTGYYRAGATGYGVRLLTRFFLDI